MLVVDDESDIRRLVREALTSIDCSVLEAPGGHQAMEILKREPVDLMILDLKMNAGSGIDLLRLMRRRHLGVPTVVISAFLSPDLIEKLAAMGVKKVLAKPFRVSRVTDEVRELLRN